MNWKPNYFICGFKCQDNLQLVNQATMNAFMYLTKPFILTISFFKRRSVLHIKTQNRYFYVLECTQHFVRTYVWPMKNFCVHSKMASYDDVFSCQRS